MERTQLEHFLAVVDHGSFTAAADACYITQPALSHSIRALEQDLGSQLFHRLPKGVSLTASGEALETSARRIVREMAAARSRVHQVEGLTLGTLEVASLPGLLLDPLADLIGRFRERHPSVLVRVSHAETPEDVHDRVRRGRAELGLADHVAELPARLDTDMVLEQEFAVLGHPDVLGPDDVLDIDDLLRLDVVTGPRGSDVRTHLQRAAAARGQDFSPIVEVEHRGAALYLATAGAGVAVLPRPLAELGEAHGARVVALTPRWTRTVHLSRRCGLLSPAAAAMREVALSTSTNRPA